ncbi:MAG: hypothetical protein ABR592_05645 [Nitriliruptorales bacterium]
MSVDQFPEVNVERDVDSPTPATHLREEALCGVSRRQIGHLQSLTARAVRAEFSAALFEAVDRGLRMHEWKEMDLPSKTKTTQSTCLSLAMKPSRVTNLLSGHSR